MKFVVAAAFVLSVVIDQVLAGEGWSWQTGNLRNSYESAGEFIGTAPACAATSSDCINKGLNFWYSVTSGNGSKCSSGRKVYCNKYPSPYTNTWWYGTATFCAASCGDCGGASTCVATDGSGDGNSCSCATWFGSCTNEKALCATYSSRRLEEEDDAGNYNTSRVPVQKGVDIGFYVFFGDDFEDGSLLERNLSLLTDFKTGLAATLTEIVPGVVTTADSGYVKAYGFTDWQHVGGNFSDLFANVTSLGYVNIRFAYTAEASAGSIEQYLDNLVDTQATDTFTAVLEEKIHALSFGELAVPVEVYLVEANCFVTDIETFCQELVEDLGDSGDGALDMRKVFSYHWLFCLVSVAFLNFL